MNTSDNASAKAHVLDRMMYLLEERSVSHLTERDPHFAKVVGELYESLAVHAERIRTKH